MYHSAAMSHRKTEPRSHGHLKRNLNCSDLQRTGGSVAVAVVGEEMEHVDNNGRGGGWALPSFYNSVHLDTEISRLLLL